MAQHDAPPMPAPAARRDRVIALALAAAALFLRLPLAGAEEGWFDELFSVVTASLTPGEVIGTALKEQTNPPGFYLLAHVWGLLGDGSVPWQRLLPALCGGIAPAVFFLAARRLDFGRVAAASGAVLLAVSPILWRMSLEVRAYAPVALLAALALWLGADLLAGVAVSTRRVMAIAALHVAMVAFHYFAAFSVLGLSVAAALALRWSGGSWPGAIRRALLLGGPAALALSAWMWAVVVGAELPFGTTVTWIPEQHLGAVLRDLLSAMFGFVTAADLALAAATMLLATAIALQWALRRDPENRHRQRVARAVLVLTLLPLAGAMVAHLIADRQLIVTRYFAALLPALFLLPAFAIDALPAPRRRLVATVAVLWWGTTGVLHFGERNRKPDWTTMLAHLAPAGRATLCVDRTFVGLGFLYYARTGGYDGVQVIPQERCAVGPGLTWWVTHVDPRGGPTAPTPPGLALGPRIVLSRGVQQMDARRVIGRVVPTAP